MGNDRVDVALHPRTARAGRDSGGGRLVAELNDETQLVLAEGRFDGTHDSRMSAQGYRLTNFELLLTAYAARRDDLVSAA